MVTSQSSSDNLWLGAAQFGTSKEYEWSDHTPFNFENWETSSFFVQTSIGRVIQ